MARTPGESRIPVFRSSAGTLGTSSLPRPTMLVAPCTSASTPSSPGCVSAATVGQRVCVGGEVTGVLRFFGPTHLDPGGGMWCGVELDTPHGLNDGCVRGVRYFRCRPHYGILAPENKVRMAIPTRQGTNKSIPQPGIKRRMPQDRDDKGSRGSRRENKTSESSSGSSQEEITPPADDQPSPCQPEDPRQLRSATATPTPSTSALPWDAWDVSPSSSKRNSSEIQALPPDDSLVTESVSPKEMALVSPAGSEGYSFSQRRLTGGMVLPLYQGSPPNAPPPLSSKQSSFELDDSLGILTPDQMATDFTVTSTNAGSEDEDEQLGASDLGGLMLEEVPPSPQASNAEGGLMSPQPGTADMDGLIGSADISELMLEEPPPSPPHDEVEEPISALHDSVSEISSAADMTAKGTASTCSQHQSVSSSSHQAAPSCSFITSVTSITSLDTGYQGDGEWSRPASRADNSPTAPPPPPPGVMAVDVHKLKFDVMTDSDFFSDPGAAGTESDAEHEAAGMTVGDRRARVIDGTLYGTSPANSVAGALPVAPAHLMTSSAATIEEMDSSGIFSDIERRPDTSETSFSIPPSKLAEPETKPNESLDETIVNETNKITSEVLNTTFNVDEPVEDNETPKNTGALPANKEENKTIKKHKMPKRNVTSKIKALIESNPTPKSDENQENRRPKKGGKWDAVMNKIAQNQAEEKSRPKVKEVKSRVFANIAQASPQSAKNSPRASVANSRTNISSRPSSARSRRENASTPKPKPRRNRLRGGESTSSLRVDEEGASPNSSHCSSISDVSQTPSLHKPTPPRSTKKRTATLDGIARASSPLSDVSTNSAPPQIAARTAANNNNNALLNGRHTTNSPSVKAPISGAASVQQRNQRNALLSATPPTRRAPGAATATHKTLPEKSVTPAAVVTPTPPEMKTPLSIRKQAARISHKTPPLRDHNRVSSSRHPLNASDTAVNGKTEVVKAAPAPPAPAPLPPHLLRELKHASAGCEAMAVLVQYLVHSLDAYSAPRLKNELASMREEWVRTKLELEEAQAGYRRLQESLSDEVSAHERREEAQRVEHAQLVATLEAAQQDALDSAQNQHKAAQERLQEELEIAHGKHKTHEEALTELSRELGEERAASARRAEESARREAELGEQLAKVSAELAETKADSRKFLESMHKDKDSKLQATAERCQTLEKEVDSLRVVLEMRHAELQTLRKASAEAQERADQLAVAKIDLSAARSKLEDLQSQLDAKTSTERQLKDENKSLTESYMIETQQNRRLSQAQEELQWKLKHTFEVVNKLAVNSSISMTNSLHFPVSPLLGRRSFGNTTLNGNGSSLNNNSNSRLSPSLDDDLPDSPRMKVMAEKSDSVAWVLDMNEPVDAILERVASNQRQRQDRSSPGRSLPKKSASTSCVPSDQRGKLAGRKSRFNRGVSTSTPASDTRCRSRSVSTDSESLELESKSCSSQPERHENGDVKKESLTTSSSSQSSQPTSPSTMLTLPFKLQLQPQESAGEAMISEEISDDAQSDCEAHQAVEAGSGRSSESSSIVMANAAQLDMEEDDEIEEVEVPCKPQAACRLNCPTHPPVRSSPTPDSISQLGFTDCSTAMDLSWSEDFELFPSESEG